MAACPSCGFEYEGNFKFCPECAAPLAAPVAAREQRKTVTVLFCDVTGSTALGERLDPESLRRVMARYFAAASEVVERHGGTVEKFIGDAVMAVFGIPVLHEDDALRAVRAAADLRSSLVGLNEELLRDFGTELELRIGVNTGEVVTGTQERLATGDAVNVAARLEQAAAPGEILLGAETLRLARDAIEVETVQPLELKGKTDRVGAFRLLRVEAGAPGLARHLDAPLVGRTDELELLRGAWERTVRDGSCHLFTVLGSAGVGKSRLVVEFLASLAAAGVVHGRCLSYGEGITYWPVVEVLKQLLGGDTARVDGYGLDGHAVVAIRSVLGDKSAFASAEEIAWAVRKLLEAVAAEQPLVVVLDDLHWGEETYLDLVEHIADLSRGAPILLLCMARPELLDRHPGWGGGKLNATVVLLEPLSAGETDALIEELLVDEEIDDALRGRIREAAEGNPLFVEEMIAMVRESHGGDVIVPPTIQALLAARLDQLDPAERGVLERGSVEGRVFHRGAVEALAPDDVSAGGRLTSLVRKELVRPDRTQIPGDDAFRFRHLLIRDAAYDALPKEARAELHERFADWLEGHGADLVELDEILGYHLEQAYRYRAQLGPVGHQVEEIGQRARERLCDAGSRALERNDFGAAITLLERAQSLLQTGSLDVDLELLLVEALFASGRPAEAVVLATSVAERATAAGDIRGALRAKLRAARFASNVDSSGRAEETLELATLARPIFEDAKDDAGLVATEQALAFALFWRNDFEGLADVTARWVAVARRSGNRGAEMEGLAWQVIAWFFGPMPVEDFLIALDSQPGEHDASHRQVFRAEALAMRGDFDSARSTVAAYRARVEELGGKTMLAVSAMGSSEIEMLAGDNETAERVLAEGCDQLDAMGEVAWLSTMAGMRGEALYRLGRLDEAEASAARGLEVGAPDDVVTQVISRCVIGKVRARQEKYGEAERLLREATALAQTGDSVLMTADALLDLGEVLDLAGKQSEATAKVEEALDLYERKGNLVQAQQARERLEKLQALSGR